MKALTGKEKSLIGMIHVPALPGTPSSSLEVKEILKTSVEEARHLEEQGFDGVILENMHDTPYLNRHCGPEIVATMSAVVSAVRQMIDIPVGVQILAGCNKEALAVALAAQAQFIRAEGYVFGHIADEGYIQSDAGELLRYRKMIGAENVLIAADIKKKHSSHYVTSDVSIEETARAAEFFQADAVIITGDSTGEEASTSDIKSVSKTIGLPIMIGSGITAENLEMYWSHAHAFIIGSYIKEEGKWHNPISPDRVHALVRAAEKLRG